MLRVVADHSQLTKTDSLGAMMATLSEAKPSWSLRRRSGFALFDALEEHWVIEDGHPVAR